MVWPGGRAVATVEQYSEGVVRNALRANGFEVDGDQCSDFHELLTGVVRHVGAHYTQIIVQILNDPGDDHSAPDLVSWCVEEIARIFSYALQKMQARLVDAFSISISWTRPIRCAEAMSGAAWLEEVCVEAVTQRRAMQALPVRSSKIERNKRRRKWSPAEVDVVAVLRTYFR